MNWFKRSMVVGALSAGMLLGGCAQPNQGSGRSSSSGSLALSSDDSLLYAVDTDNGTVTVLDTKTDSKVATVKVGEQPARIVVGADDTLYVTNRGSNSVSVIRKGDWKQAAQIAVGTEPVGIAVSPDNKMLYVVNATSADSAEFGTLIGIDLATLQPTFEVQVGAEPRGLTLLGNDKAVVTLYKEGELVEVDLTTKAVTSNKIGIYEAANASRSSGASPLSVSTFKARAMGEVVATPDGTRLFAPVIWARENPIGRTPSSAGGYYSAGGPCNIGAVASAGIVVADHGATGGLTPQVDDLTACVSSGTNIETKDFPTTTLAGSGRDSSGRPTLTAIQAPVAAAIDATGTWVYLVNKESSNVAVLPAFRRSGEDLNFRGSGTSVRSIVELNPGSPEASSGADGIALTRNGNKAYVYNQFDHRIDVITSVEKDGAKVLTKTSSIPVTGDLLAPEIVAGRKLFFNAVDRRVSGPTTNVSCATCHLEGLEDGHVWNFPDGLRQTPALAGRKLKDTGPYHWSGEFPDTQKFMSHTIIQRMGGTGLNTAKDVLNMVDYIESIPAPQNANLKAVRTDAQLRGAQVFQAAKCGTCHSGALLTNKTSSDVGTLGPKDNGIALTKGLDVPSLLGLARTAPYLHDGSARTLLDRLNKLDGDKHGVTSTLSANQKSDLVAYLNTL